MPPPPPLNIIAALNVKQYDSYLHERTLLPETCFILEWNISLDTIFSRNLRIITLCTRLLIANMDLTTTLTVPINMVPITTSTVRPMVIHTAPMATTTTIIMRQVTVADITLVPTARHMDQRAPSEFYTRHIVQVAYALTIEALNSFRGT